MKLILIIVPCFNEEEAVKIFYNETVKYLKDLRKKELEYEILFIDDGSKDTTLLQIKEIAKEDKK